jgi:hypothetical protein
MSSVLTKSQTKTFTKSGRNLRGELVKITATVRYDDQCGNGKNTFSITGSMSDGSGGCIHEDIAHFFPELAPLIKWHLVSSDGPMHYLANVVYMAGDRDHNGLKAGELKQIRNGRTGKLSWKRVEPGLPKYLDQDETPTQSELITYEPWCIKGEGKARDLKAARSIAVWPDATDAELCAEPEELKAALKARLPALLAEFQAAVEGFGFVF